MNKIYVVRHSYKNGPIEEFYTDRNAAALRVFNLILNVEQVENQEQICFSVEEKDKHGFSRRS